MTVDHMMINIASSDMLDDTANTIIAKLKAAEELAFQYKGLLEWIDNDECECAKCDDHDKLIQVLTDYHEVGAGQ